MKIGIISSGNETLSLFRILTKFDHEYLVVHDQTHFPFGTKDFEYIVKEIKKSVQFLVAQGAENIIVDPLYELALGQDEEVKKYIFPLFTEYCLFAFFHSLVGKIGLLCEAGTFVQAQHIVNGLEQHYTPTEAQRKTKKFRFPFDYRVKVAGPWTFGIQQLGVHNPYLIRTLKNDLRYFKDAMVDTIIPLYYHHFRMQRTMKAFFQSKKIRFWDLSYLTECFKKLTEGREDTYMVQVWTNQSSAFLEQEKELMWLLGRGKTVVPIISSSS